MSSPQTLTQTPVDFVSGDFDALASHMQHCATAHGRWFGFKSGFQRMRSAAAGRIVTMAFVATVLAIGLYAVA